MAAVSKIKGVQFNYVNFLWKELARIRELEVRREYIAAFNLSLSLTKFLPADIQDHFKDDIIKYRKDMANIPKICKIKAIDRFNADVRMNQIAQSYARMRLDEFMSKVCRYLDQKGYMERVAPEVPTGISHTLRT